jgi:hypothetical protein
MMDNRQYAVWKKHINMNLRKIRRAEQWLGGGGTANIGVEVF